jgi:hypothetical protein
MIPLGWMALALVFFLVLPTGWRTDIVTISTVAAGLAWAMLVASLGPFFQSKARVGESAPILAFRLGIAVAYAGAVAWITLRFAIPPKGVPFGLVAVAQAVAFSVAILSYLAAGLVGIKVRQVASSEEALRKGLEEIRGAFASLNREAIGAGSLSAGLRDGLGRLSDRLQYTSPSDKPDAVASEERLLSGIQRLKDWMNFLKSLNATEVQAAPQMEELKRILAELENEAAFRSRIKS